MRNRIRQISFNALIIGLAFVHSAAARAQNVGELPDAETILDRYVEVTGGGDAYESIRSQIIHASMEIAGQGISGGLTIYQEGDNYFTSTDLPGVGAVEAGVTDGVAWENSVLMGPRIRSGAERAQALREASMNAPARWRELYPQVETAGMATINGEDAYEVVMTPAEGGPQSMYFSVDSGLALRTDIVASTQLGDIPAQVTMADYADFGGVLTPTTMTQSLAGQSVQITIDSIEINAQIPAGTFDLPSAVAALLE